MTFPSGVKLRAAATYANPPHTTSLVPNVEGSGPAIAQKTSLRQLKKIINQTVPHAGTDMPKSGVPSAKCS